MESRRKLFDNLNHIRVVEALVVTGLLLLIAFLYDYRFALNDDVFINDILSGRYSGHPDIHNISVLSPLNMLFVLLYRISTTVPWFGTAMILFQFLSIYQIVICLLRSMPSTGRSLFAIILTILFSGIMWTELVIVQYTYTCALLMTSALMRLYCTGDFLGRQGEGFRFLSIFLQLMTAFCLRTEIFLFFLPFLILLMMVQYFNDNGFHFVKRAVLKWCVIWVSILLGCTAMLIINSCSYSGEDYREYRRVDEYRTTLYDFLALPSYQENEAFYQEAGISKSQYDLLENYNFQLDSDITWETIQRIVDYVEESRLRQYSGFKRLYMKYITLPVGDGIWSYRHRLTLDPLFRGDESPWNYVCLALYLAVMVATVCSGRIRNLLYLAMLFAVRSGLWMFLILRQRTPVRVTHSLFLIEIVCLLLLFLETLQRLSGSEIRRKRLTAYFLMTTLFMGGCFVLWANVTSCQKEYREIVERNGEWEQLTGYCADHEEAFYFMDVYSTVDYAEAIYTGTCGTQSNVMNDRKHTYNGMKNYDLAGGWLSKSPLCIEKYGQYGFEDALQGLLEQDNVYWVMKKDRPIQWLIDFCLEKGYEVRPEVVDTIADTFAVYRIVPLRGQDSDMRSDL